MKESKNQIKPPLLKKKKFLRELDLKFMSKLRFKLQNKSQSQRNQGLVLSN